MAELMLKNECVHCQKPAANGDHVFIAAAGTAKTIGNMVSVESDLAMTCLACITEISQGGEDESTH
jgi:hypothetical protein